jgi:uncharacterized protein (TIGR03067 family)
MSRYVVTVLVAGLVLGAGPAQEDDAKKDHDALQGTWKVISAESDGRPFGELMGETMTFEKDSFVIKDKDGVIIKGTFTIDPSKRPKAMDLRMADKKVEGQFRDAKAIYELTKGGLKCCWGEAGKDNRPKEFATKEGSNSTLFTMEREKK